MKEIALLPYWNSDLDLEIASWFPLGLDYQPVSANHFYSPQLRRIAAGCLERGSELFFMASPRMGCIGSLMRDNFYKAAPYGRVSLGFMMVLGYSSRMEILIGGELKSQEDAGVSAGVAFCSLWNAGVLLGSMKVIALVSDEIIFDEEKFLDGFERTLSGPGERTGLSYFAERFGYRRFCMPYETDDPLQLRISQLLYEMEFTETRQMVGPSPEVPFPPFLGITLSAAMEDA